MYKIVIIGTGYVGLTTGATLAFLGHQVTCVDIDQYKLKNLQEGKTPFFEPFIEDLMRSAGVKLSFSNNLEKAIKNSEISFITVGTPSNEDGSVDLSAVAKVAKSIGGNLNKHQKHLIVNKSTVPIGSGNYVESLVCEGYRNKYDEKEDFGQLQIASNPEFLREGSAVSDSLYPDRIVIGSNNKLTLDFLKEFYRPLAKQTFTPPSFAPRPPGLEFVPLITTDLISAETIKYAANAFLATKISFINEVAGLAEYAGADIVEIAQAIGLDSRIGKQFLQAGIGWGGSCFGKDIKAMISSGQDYKYPMPLLEATIKVNNRQRFSVTNKLQQELKVLKGCVIGLLGLSFKPNTDDMRDAPVLYIIDQLFQRGVHLRVHDPVSMPACQKLFPDLPVKYVESIEELASDADALVLVTDWIEYRKADWATIFLAMKQKIIIDGRNHLDRQKLLELGFLYRGVGQ